MKAGSSWDGWPDRTEPALWTGGMADMQKHGLMCSALRQATVAVENKQSAREQLCKEFALWRVALAFGFVFDVDDFVASIGK